MNGWLTILTRRAAAPCNTFLAALFLATSATAAITGFQIETIPLQEPRTVNPSNIAVAPDGTIWFTDITFRQVGRIAPDSEETVG